MPSGIYPRTEEHKKHISKSLSGRQLTKAHKKHISKSLDGRIYSTEHKNAISLGMRKYWLTKNSFTY